MPCRGGTTSLRHLDTIKLSSNQWKIDKRMDLYTIDVSIIF